MKKRHALIAAVAAALMLVGFSAAPAHADPDNIDEVEEELDEKANELEKITEEYNGAREDLKDTKDRIEEIEDSLPELEDEAEESREALGDIATETYTSGSAMSGANMVAQSPEQAIDRMTLLQSINASQASETVEHSSKLTEVEEEQETLEELQDEQSDTEEDIKEKKETIEGEIDELEALQEEYGLDDGGDEGLGDAPSAPSGDAGAVVQFAYDQVGKPYGYGEAGPDAYDCSGLTLSAWGEAGVSLAHQASQQRQQTANVSESELEPGDLVFYYDDLHHVALYVGDGQVVHAPQSGQDVSVASVNDMPVHSYGRP